MIEDWKKNWPNWQDFLFKPFHGIPKAYKGGNKV